MKIGVSEIATARLLLRRPRADDLQAMHEILSDARAMQYWATLPHGSIEVSREWLEAEIAALASNADTFVVEREGRVIGRVGAWKLPELGFIFHPDVWGQGIAYEATRAYIDHAFAAHRIDRLTADVDPRNAASLGLLRKLGFAETGRAEKTFLIGGNWYDSVYLALTRSGWRGNRSGPLRDGRRSDESAAK